MEGYKIFCLSNLENEIWGEIKDFPGYLVSNFGRVKSVGRKVKNKNHLMTIKEIIRKQSLDHNGYPVVALCNKTRYKTKIVHRLVALAFIPNPENKPYVNHKNGVQTDNRVDNLEWVTNSENLIHAYRVLKIKLPESKVVKEVFQFSKTGVFIKKWKSRIEAAKSLGISVCGINNVVGGRKKTAGGYMWSKTEVLDPNVISSYVPHEKSILLNGKMVSHSQAERDLGFTSGLIYSRQKLGWTMGKTLSTPPPQKIKK